MEVLKMLKEVNPETLKQNLSELVSLGGRLQKVGEELEKTVTDITGDVITLASYVPDEGVEKVTIPITLFNDMVSGYREILKLITTEGMNESVRLMRIESIYNNLKEGLEPYVEPEPPKQETMRDVYEQDKFERMLNMR
jgi:hypothetical protein